MDCGLCRGRARAEELSRCRPCRCRGAGGIGGQAMMIASRLKMELSPVHMMRAAGITPDPWQVRFLSSQAPRLMLNCSRQIGKSTMTGGKAIHTALYTPESMILLLSP